MNSNQSQAVETEREHAFNGEVPAPEFVSIETTRFCNFQCPMCLQFQDGTTVTGPHMDQVLFERVAAETFPHARRFQPSVSGEPLMSKGLPYMLSEAQKYGVKTEVCSNASLLKEKMRKAILPSLGKLIVSFDGATKDTFEWIREGGDFDDVVTNVTALCKEAKEIPVTNRPLIGLACVLMRRNIEELPMLVDLAAKIGVDYLATSHVHPVTDLMKEQSLVHFTDLAIEYIAKAKARAEEIGLTMMVQPLDQLIASTATSDAERRSYAVENGIVEGLDHHVVHLNSLRQFPQVGPSESDYQEIVERRQSAQENSNFLKQTERNESAPKRESIWVCDFLWNKTYVALDGNVKACCVPGTPNLGDLTTQKFSEIWSSPGYTRMREDLVRKDPVPFCKGCQHIRELTDPVEIDFWMQGREAPKGHNTAPMPHILDPLRVRSAGEASAPEFSQDQAVAVEAEKSDADTHSSPPTLIWPPHEGAEGYVVEFSVDSFKSLEFATDWNDQPMLSTPSFQIPDWGWNKTPLGIAVTWRVLAAIGDRPSWPEVARGSFERVED